MACGLWLGVDVGFQHRKDTRQYVMCYKHMVEKNPTEHTYVMLGEAYMQIQEPENAISAFEEALKLNPSDAALASKIGKALVSTHDYLRAIEYYEAALKRAPNNRSLRSDLTQLYCRLQKFDEVHRSVCVCVDTLPCHPGIDQATPQQARHLLSVALSSNEQEDTMSLMSTVKNHLLLGEVYKGTGDLAQAIETTEQALRLQESVLVKVRGEAPGNERRGQRASLTPHGGGWRTYSTHTHCPTCPPSHHRHAA